MPALIEFNTIEENIELCKELNLNFIELNMNFPYNMINNVKPIQLRNLSLKNNVEFTMHMPDDADIASFYEDVAHGYLDLFINTIKWANEANVKLLNMHIAKGTYMTLPDKKVFVNEKYSNLYVAKFLDSIKKISEIASIYNIAICIENIGNFGLNYVQRILDIALSFDNIFLTWDVGHDYISNYSDKEILFKYKDKIKHMHLHDAIQSKDHLILSEGDVNIEECIDFAFKHELTMLVELKSKSALIKSIQSINKI
jgi:sugar phosphate isomerase/epimerase